MEVYRAKAGFAPVHAEPDVNISILSFEKGELFEVLETDKESKPWWGARALKDETVGFIPANHFKKNGNPPLDENPTEEQQSARELHMQTLAELQKRINFKHPEYYYPEMIPEPDYSDSEEESETGLQRERKPTLNGHFSEDGLIVPKKLSNPCLESKDRQNLHKELMFNQKIGKNVLNQKSELQKAMDKFQDDQKKKELEQERLSKRTILEKKLEEQANKLKTEEDIEEKQEKPSESEFFRVHAKVRARMESQ